MSAFRTTTSTTSTTGSFSHSALQADRPGRSSSTTTASTITRHGTPSNGYHHDGIHCYTVAGGLPKHITDFYIYNNRFYNMNNELDRADLH